jgi:hypothetical protein
MTEFVHRYGIEAAIEGYQECVHLFETDLNKIKDNVELAAGGRDHIQYNELQNKLIR